MGGPISDPLSQLSLPPGFRFYPTDEELLVQYLCRKVAGHHFSLQIIAEIDLYKYDPWILPSKAVFGEKEWYFFSPRDRKYPNGSRPNRVAGSGYWKATGTDKLISTEGRKVGIKKSLVFYVGKAPKGSKTNWIMHEYRLLEHSRKNGSSKLDDWVLCRIYKKNSSAQRSASSCDYSAGESMTSSSTQQIDEMLESLPEVDDRSFALPRASSLMRSLQQNGEEDQKPFNLQRLGSENFDWASLAAASSLPELMTQSQTRTQTQGTVNNSNCTNNVQMNPSTGRLGRVEFEVQSGLRGHQANNSNGLSQGGFTNSLNPFGFSYPLSSADEWIRVYPTVKK